MGWSIAIFCRIFSHTIKFKYYFDVRLLINVVPLLWNKPNRSTNRLIKCIKLITIYCQSPRTEYTGINVSRIQLAQHAIGNIIDEPADGRVIVAALEIVEAGLGIVIIAAVAKGVDVPDEGGIRSLFAVFIVHGVVAPRAVVVGRDERTGGIQKGNDIALRVEDVVIELRCLAMLVDHGKRLAAVVVDKLEELP